jgi:hypothetical protein
MQDVLVKGFPTEVSDYIELPDMAELLCYPMFNNTFIEEAYKYGTEFQRNLLDKLPLRNTKKSITVRSEVKVLAPTQRSVTGFNKIAYENNDNEWHIDDEDSIFLKHQCNYYDEKDIYHLLMSKTTGMTQFNKNEFVIENWDVNRSLNDFIEHAIHHPMFEYEEAPSNRIITFTNNIHRATPTKGLEFRYIFRVAETNVVRQPEQGKYTWSRNKESIVHDMDGYKKSSIRQGKDHVVMFIPPNYPFIGHEMEKK